MDSYRVEKKAVMKIALADEDAEIGPKLFVENESFKRSAGNLVYELTRQR